MSEEKSLFDELNELFSKTEHSGFGTYTQYTQNYGHIPDNQYDHAWGLLNPPPKKIEKDGFDLLTDQTILLGNIDNEKSLRMYQIDLFFLSNMLALARNDPMMRYVFEPLWANEKMEIRITGTIGGTERSLQAFHIPVLKQQKGFKILGGRKKKQPIEYVIPQEDEGMY